VTDAGTPGISDPGALLVRRAVEQGYRSSRCRVERRDLGRQRERLRPAPFPLRRVLAAEGEGGAPGMLDELRPMRAQLVFYESPHRLAATLGDMQAALGDRPALVARELTKVQRGTARGTLFSAGGAFSNEVRGEIVIGRLRCLRRGRRARGPSDLSAKCGAAERGERPRRSPKRSPAAKASARSISSRSS